MAGRPLEATIGVAAFARHRGFMPTVLSRNALAVAAAVSPRHRRWRRLLASLDLDPDALQRPVAPPGERDFIVCGSPRSGTTLMAAMLFQPPRVVTVSEPWDGLRLPPRELFAGLRREVEHTGRLTRGRLEVDALRTHRSVRWGREQEGSYPVEVAPGWSLGVKWPAFWRYLDLLPDTRFLVCVRHPYEVISSYRRKGGALAAGLEYDAAFNRSMNRQLRAATPDPRVRQVLLYDHIVQGILPHIGRSNVFLVRYERWYSDPARLLADIAAFLDVELGPPPVDVREEPAGSDLSGDDRALVRRWCTTAASLGYHLDEGTREDG